MVAAANKPYDVKESSSSAQVEPIDTSVSVDGPAEPPVLDESVLLLSTPSNLPLRTCAHRTGATDWARR